MSDTITRPRRSARRCTDCKTGRAASGSDESPRTLVDTIAVVFPLGAMPEDCERLLQIRPDSGSWFFGGPRAELSAGSNFSVQKKTRQGRIQCSVPRVLNDHNGEGAEARLVLPVVESLLGEVEDKGFVVQLAEAGEARVTRLDVCRDFHHAAEVPQLMAGLAGLPGEWGSTSTLYFGTDGSPETLQVNTGEWMARLYMKGLQDRSAAACLVRYEGEAKRALGSAWCQRPTPVGSVSDITDAHVDALGGAMFERAGFGTSVRRAGSVIDAVQALPDATEQHKQKVLATSVAIGEGRGLGWVSGSDTTQRKLAHAVRDVGVIADGLSESLRLDWHTGLIRG